MTNGKSKKNSEKEKCRCWWCGEGEDTFRERLKETFRSLADDNLAEIEYNKKKRENKSTKKSEESDSRGEEDHHCCWFTKNKSSRYSQLNISVLNVLGSLFTGMINQIDDRNKEYSGKNRKYSCWWCGWGDDEFQEKLGFYQKRLKEIINSLADDIHDETKYIEKKRKHKNWEVNHCCWWCGKNEPSWFEQLDPEFLGSIGSLVTNMIALMKERKKGRFEKLQKIPVEDKRNEG